ncbi:hypothetical protein HYX00_01300 [Candidatus Woesearchaeota archaeon]|nr:hypothetical protein [Candidatus Woesearchaeota archaeon]
MDKNKAKEEIKNLIDDFKQNYQKHKKELEDKKNQRMWDFIERNKFYIVGIVIFVLILLIYSISKDKNKFN